MLYSVLQNIICLRHGSQNCLLEIMGSIFDLPEHGTDALSRNKTCAAGGMEYAGNMSIEEAKRLLLSHVRECEDDTVKVRHCTDGAYFNGAGNKSKMAYMLNMCQSMNRVGCDVVSIAAQGHNVDPAECGPRQAEHRLRKITAKSIGSFHESAANKYDKNIHCDLAVDDDIEWTDSVEQNRNR